MTTIAFKDGVLAADTQTTSHGRPYGYAKKVGAYLEGSLPYLFASTGDTAIGQRFREWASKGGAVGLAGPCPLMRQDEQDAAGFVIWDDGTFSTYERDLPPSRLKLPLCDYGYYLAVGSGSDIAAGAMAAGACAEQAVRIAIQLDSHTGGHVQTAELLPKGTG